MLESPKLTQNSWITYNCDPWHQKWPHPPSIHSATINFLKEWLQRQGVIGTLSFRLKYWELAHKSRITDKCDPWCQEWPTPPNIVRSHLPLSSVTSSIGCSWYNSIHARELKICTQLKNIIWSWSYMSKQQHFPCLQIGINNILQVWRWEQTSLVQFYSWQRA